MLSLRRVASIAQKRVAITTPFQTAHFSDTFDKKERAEEQHYFK
jgi:hypothetical protein